MPRLLTLLISVAFLMLAILGMVPGPTYGNRLFGIFTATFFNQLLYFAIGVFGLSCWIKGDQAPKFFLFSTGTLLILLGIAGFYFGEGPLFYFFWANAADNVLHLALGAFLLYLGLLSHKR